MTLPHKLHIAVFWWFLAIMKLCTRSILVQKQKNWTNSVFLYQISSCWFFSGITLFDNTVNYDLTLSWGGGVVVVQFCTTPRIFNFTHRKYFSRASMICNFWMHHIRHWIAKFEYSSFFTLKVTAFFWKVPTVIFVNQVQCPCKLVKTENVITSSEIIF